MVMASSSGALAQQTQLDGGLAAGNYFDYADDDVAIQREYEIMESLSGHYTDPYFPPDARSLYFDPFHPPRGASPGTSFIWCRLSKGEVLQCDAPVYCKCNQQSSQIIQGALGNSYFVNALRILAATQNDGKQIMRLLVSDKYASQGMYTFKFFKAGRWRYVHVDDLIPCRQSGRVNFCRNVDMNETFAMLLEKAYAKLHGCYEALIYGLIEKVLNDLTAGGHTRCFRNERADLDSVCDKAWDFIEKGLEGGHTVACGKFLPDTYSEKLADRQGITAGVVYQVMDAMLVKNPPTAELDSISIGMVCVRNLQPDEGRFVGRWSFGHLLWQQYKDIGIILRHRERELQFRRGLGLDPNARDEETNELINFVKDDNKKFKLFREDEANIKAISERDGLGLDYIGRTRFPPPQPSETDLYWIQIEDFVDVFNRTFSMCDPSVPPRGVQQYKAGFKRYYSKWMPGDFLCGSGGPPILLKLPSPPKAPNPAEPEIDSVLKDLRDALAASSNDARGAGEGEEASAPPAPSTRTSRRVTTPAPPVESGSGEEKLTAGSESGPAPRSSFREGKQQQEGGEEEAAPQAAAEEKTLPPSNEEIAANAAGVAAAGGNETTTGSVAAQPTRTGDYVPIVVEPVPIGFIYDDEDDGGEKEEVVEEEEAWDPIQINEDFTDNPMYPFSVTEPAQVCMSLYQPDRRWSACRLGEDPRNVVATEFASRGERLAACMRYPQAIGFLVVRLLGLKVRVTDFKLRKVQGGSDDVDFSNLASACVKLRPGRYAVIPFTHEVLGKAQDYILHASFNSAQVEWEVNDLIAERPKDDDISDDESGADDDDEEEEDEEDQSPEAVREREAAQEARRLAKRKARYDALEHKPPQLVLVPAWEYAEDSENMATISVFDEVGSFALITQSTLPACLPVCTPSHPPSPPTPPPLHPTTNAGGRPVEAPHVPALRRARPEEDGQGHPEDPRGQGQGRPAGQGESPGGAAAARGALSLQCFQAEADQADQGWRNQGHVLQVRVTSKELRVKVLSPSE